MTVNKELNGNTLTMSLHGKLDTASAPAFESEMNAIPTEVTKLILDFTDLAYISSASLRILLSTHFKMLSRGEMIVKNPQKAVKKVFEITGLDDFLDLN